MSSNETEDRRLIHSTFERLPEEKKDRILQAARAEFIHNPYEKTSINRILAEAGIPKGSFYQYFDDKSDLFSLCINAVYRKLNDERKKNGELLLESGMLRMKRLGYEKGYQLFSKELNEYLSEEDFALFENMLHAPQHIRTFVQLNAASALIAPAISEELRNDINVRKDIDYDYYAYLLSLTEVIPVDYGTRKDLPMEDFFFLGYKYMQSIYDSIMR